MCLEGVEMVGRLKMMRYDQQVKSVGQVQKSKSHHPILIKRLEGIDRLRILKVLPHPNNQNPTTQPRLRLRMREEEIGV